MGKKITVFTASQCGPCKEISEILALNRWESDIEDSKLRVVDVETEEGFSELQQHMDVVNALPSAVYDGKLCRIQIDEDAHIIIFSCEGQPD